MLLSTLLFISVLLTPLVLSLRPPESIVFNEYIQFQSLSSLNAGIKELKTSVLLASDNYYYSVSNTGCQYDSGCIYRFSSNFTQFNDCSNNDGIEIVHSFIDTSEVIDFDLICYTNCSILLGAGKGSGLAEAGAIFSYNIYTGKYDKLMDFQNQNIGHEYR